MAKNAVLEEHRKLIQHVVELDEWAAANNARRDDWGPELGRLAGVVHEQLKQHFSGDSEGTFFSEVATKCPHLLGRVTKLSAEHAEILKEFRLVAEHAGRLERSDSTRVAKIAAQARRAVAVLRRHEAEENELIFNAFWDDLGGAD